MAHTHRNTHAQIHTETYKHRNLKKKKKDKVFNPSTREADLCEFKASL